tara:strand:+ start:400 stop:1983 length:1584 start_codon:yes stop_codon:yes gene_type:complete
MAETFDNPLKNLLLDKMISDGYFKRDNLDKSTIQTISDLKDSEVLQLLKSFGVGPKIVKKDGGIVNMNSGGDALLGQLVEKLKNKPRLASATETMLDQIAALDEPKDVVVERQTTKTSNVVKGSEVMRKMGPEVIEVFDKAGITKAQIAKIQKVPDINDYLDDFDGFNKAMKKYRTTALKGLNEKQLAAIQKTGYLSGYKTNIMEDIMKKGASYNPKSKKYTIKPKYKNVLTLNKKGEPAINKAFQNKYLDENFDYVFKTKASATGVKKPKIQSQIYTKIQDLGKKTLNKAQQLNLDFTLAQIDKLFQTGQTKKAKAALAALVTLVSKGTFGAVATKAIGTATNPVLGAVLSAPDVYRAGKFAKEEFIDPGIEAIAEPAAAKMVEGENMLANLLKSKIPNFEKGGPVDMPDPRYATTPEEISTENLMLIEKVLTDMYKKQGGPLNDSQVERLALELARADSIGDKKVNFGGTSEDNINLLINGINMLQGSALEKAKATDGNPTLGEITESTKDFITRGMNKLSRMFD